jgi:hypothetical protein
VKSSQYRLASGDHQRTVDIYATLEIFRTRSVLSSVPNQRLSTGRPQLEPNEVVRMVAQARTDFERMIGSMRERLRPTRARLFAEWLRTYVGLNCAGTG